MRKLFLLFLIYSISTVKSQNAKIDSLTKLLKTTNGSKKIELLITLSEELRSKDEKKSIASAKEAVKLAKESGNELLLLNAKVAEGRVYLKYGNEKEGLPVLTKALETANDLKNSKALKKIYDGLYYYKRDVLDDNKGSIDLMSEALKVAESYKDNDFIAGVHSNLGVAYYYSGDLVSAEKEFVLCSDYNIKAGNKADAAGMLMNIGVINFNSGKNKESLVYYEKAIKVFKELDASLDIGKCLVNIAMTEQSMGKIPEALEKFKEAEKYYLKANDKESYAGCVENIGSVYESQGQIDKALKQFFESLKIREEIKDNKGIALSYSNIADIYKELKQYKLALDYIQKSIDIEKTIKNPLKIASRLSTKGTIYFDMNNFKESEKCYLEALKIREGIGNQKELGGSYISMGNICLKMNKPDEALDYYLKALKIKEAMNDQPAIAGITSNIGVIYYEKKEYKKAIEYYEKALSIRSKIEDKAQLADTYLTLANAYSGLGDYKKAYDYEAKYATIKDTLFSTSLNQSISEMQAKYDNDKKQQKILLLEKDQKISTEEIKRKNTQRNAFAIGLIMLSGLILLVLIAYRQKRKSNKLLAYQKIVIEEKHKEITDSINYAQRIQKALIDSGDNWNAISKEHFILYRPKDIVSGDFYWSYSSNDIAVWAVADCTGHGVPGAFMSMIGVAFLNQIIIENKCFQAEEVLNQMRNKIIHALIQKGVENQQKDGMDISLCIWFKKENTLHYAGANNPIYIVRDKELIEYKANKMPIGYYNDNPDAFKSVSISLLPGDRIYNFSDGYPDQFGGHKGKKLMYKNFKDLLVKSHDLTMSEQMLFLESNLAKWQGNFEQVDDICVVGIQV